MKITAKDVKAILQSLLSKINKETGIEHKTVSKGVETLVLGYGRGTAEAWDGTILIDGIPEKDVTDYFEEGRQVGLDEADRIIYGAFILKTSISPAVTELVLLSEPAGVYANFYNGSEYLKQLVSAIGFNASGELVSIINYDSTKSLEYSEADDRWLWASGEVSGELPDAIGRIIEFTEPVVVPSAFFDAFGDITTTDIEDTIVTMVEQRLINVSVEGM